MQNEPSFLTVTNQVIKAVCVFLGWMMFLLIMYHIVIGRVENLITSSIIAVVILFSTLVLSTSLSREVKR